MMVHLWARGSQADYYPGSHLHCLNTFKGRRSLHEIDPSEMARAGCEPQPRDFPDGRLVISDARLGFEIKAGYAITFLFATDDVVKSWPKIATLPRQLAGRVAEMESQSKIVGLNFDFQDMPTSQRAD